MFRQLLNEFADEVSFLIAGFVMRNAILLVTLTTILLVAFARP
ncbi:hypothetical protein [Pseudorhodoplanes sp.]